MRVGPTMYVSAGVTLKCTVHFAIRPMVLDGLQRLKGQAAKTAKSLPDS